jgi:hypothetical protein
VICPLFFGQRLAELFSTPWRQNQPITLGWTRKILGRIFRYLPVRVCWDQTSQKMIAPEELRNRILEIVA